MSDRVFIADGELETALIFHQGLDLRLFAGACTDAAADMVSAITMTSVDEAAWLE